MRMTVRFGNHTLAQVLEAVSPVEPLLMSERGRFIAVELSEEKIAELRDQGYEVKEDIQFGMD